MTRKEETVWTSFVNDQNTERSDYEEDDSDDPGISNVKLLMRESMEEVDQELKRLKEDALPERKKRILKNILAEKRKRNNSEVSIGFIRRLYQ